MGDVHLDRDFDGVTMALDRSLPGPERLQKARKKRAEQLKRWAEFDRQHGKKSRAKKKRLRSKGRIVTFPPSLRLLEAVSRNDIEEVTTLLSDGVSPDSCNEEGLTALHQACLWGWVDLAALLLNRGASVNARDSGLWTPLHAACAQGFADVVQLLVPRGADLLALSEDGETPFDVCDDHETIVYLEAKMRDRGLTEEVVEDARKATEDSFISEMTQCVADLNAPDDRGVVVLHMAVAHGYDRAVRVLLEVGARSDLADVDGWTPLHAAAYWGQENIAELLVAYGARLDTANKHGQTPVELCEDVEMRARLARLKERAERGLLDLRNRRGFLPLHRSSLRGSKSRLVHKGRTEEMQSEAIAWQTMAAKQDDGDDDAEDARLENGKTASPTSLNGNGITHSTGAERVSEQATSGGKAAPTDPAPNSNDSAPADDATAVAATTTSDEEHSDATVETPSASDARMLPDPEAADQNQSSAADDNNNNSSSDENSCGGGDVQAASEQTRDVIVQQPVALAAATPVVGGDVEDARGTDLRNGDPVERSPVPATAKSVTEIGEPPDEVEKAAGAAASSQGPGASGGTDDPPPASTQVAAASDPGDKGEGTNAAERSESAFRSEGTGLTPPEGSAREASNTTGTASPALGQNSNASDLPNSVDANTAQNSADGGGAEKEPASLPKAAPATGDAISTNEVDVSAAAKPLPATGDGARSQPAATPSIDESRVLTQLLSVFDDDDLSSEEDNGGGGVAMTGLGVSDAAGGHKANGVREPRRPRWDDNDVPTFKGEVREDNSEAKGRRCCKMM